MANVIVHHLEKSRSTRVLWLLEELGVEYELKTYARDKQFRAGDDLKAVHPLGRSPVVEVDGVKLVESGAILEELLDRFDERGLRPAPGTDEHRRFRMFLHFAEGSFMPPLLVSLLTARIRSAKVPFFIKPIARRIANQIDATYTLPEATAKLAFVEGELASRDYLAGDAFTAADIQMAYGLEAARIRIGLDAYPKIRALAERIFARDAYQRAVERGGPMMP
jgi:glutathione S-transferase